MKNSLPLDLAASAGCELLMLVDPGTLRVLMASASTAATLGYPTTQLTGMSITQIETGLQGVFYWEEVAAGHAGEVRQQDDLYRCADGRLLAVTKSIERLDTGHGFCLLIRATTGNGLQAAQDVLAQTLSRLRATLESTGNGILVVDWQGGICSMNRRFSQIWGLSEALLQGQNDDAIVAFLVASVREPDTLRSRIQVVADPTTTEDTLHHLDGRVLEFTSRPQYLGEAITGRVFSVQDVTQRTLDAQALRESRDQLELRVKARTADLQALNATLQTEKERLAELVRQLESAQAQLMQSERMASIGQLAAGVAHEINNPVGFVNSNLGSLKQYVERLLSLLDVYEAAEAELLPAARARMEQARAGADLAYLRTDITDLLAESADGLQRVTRIVQDLKNFSHPDSTERQLADLEQGLESTLRVVWNELKYKCQVTKNFAGLPQIMCHPFQLNQVFMNLLVNASQAIEKQGSIHIRTGFDDTEVWVAIEDSGKGIQPEHLSRLFDPFFTTKPVGQGTGLGLSLAYGIVQKHGGRIDVQSTPGQGSTFTVWLPREHQP